MTDILKICDSSIGSIRAAYLIFPEHLSSLGKKVQIIPITTAPTLLPSGVDPAARFYDIQLDKNTGAFSEKRNIDGRHEDYYTSTLSFQIKKLRVEVDYLLELISNTQVHIMFEDNNGLVKILTFARLADEAFTGERKSVKNGYNFTFYKKSTRKTPSITNFTLDNTNPNALGLKVYTLTKAEFDALLANSALQEGLYIITDTTPKEAWISGGLDMAVNITYGPLRYVKQELTSSTILLPGISATTAEERQRMRFYRGNVQIFLDGDITIQANDYITFALPFENETFRAFY